VNVPTAQCVERRTRLREAGKPVSFHVFEGEGHELGGVGLGGYRFVEGYAKLLGDFAERHVELPNRRPAIRTPGRPRAVARRRLTRSCASVVEPTSSRSS
jgi:hypothetical protein